MAVECAACQTENRDGARFCKGCGRRLAAALPASAGELWPETQRMALQSASDPLIVSDDDETAVVGTVPEPDAAQRQPLRISEKKKRSRLVEIGFLGVLVIGAVVAAASWRADTGAADSVASPDAEKSLAAAPAESPSSASKPAATASSSAVPGPVARGPVEQQPVASPQPSPPSSPSSPPPPAELAVPARKVAQTAPQAHPQAPKPLQPPPKQAGKPAKAVAAEDPNSRKARNPAPSTPRPASPAPSTQAAAAAAATATAIAASSATATPEPAPAPSPDTVCAAQGYFGRGRCMVAQCAKAEYRNNPQCDAVRRQQQIEEEKRNPSQLN